MMRALTCATVAAFVCAVSTVETYADWQVWTVAETRRVLRRQPAEEGRWVNLAAARNEWECFQVLMRSDEEVAGVRLLPADLTGPDGAVLRASDARLYRQHQLQLDVGTYRNAGFKPGWYPDPLIPARHPKTRLSLPAARFRAMPFDLPADQTHGFLVDVFVPTGTPAGKYRGTYRLVDGDGRAKEVPVTLTVWDFDLPRVSTLQTAFGSPADRMRSYYQRRAMQGKERGLTDWTALHIRCADLLSRHRINATPPAGTVRPEPMADGTFHIPQRQIRALQSFVDRYHVNAFQIPRPTTVVKDPDRQRDTLRAWLAAWDQAAAELDRPQVTFYMYLADEPNNEEAYRFVQKWGRAVREAKSVCKVMVTEQTWTRKGDAGADAAWGDLHGAVDIWCPLFSNFQPESAAERRLAGDTIWAYTALCQRQPTPWWQIDWPLLHYRVPAWIAWRYRIRGLLYWGGMCYWDAVDDPWTDPKTFGRRDRDPRLVFNGEGTLVYPGRAVGYDGIAPSLRLKALRDAIEDYEYLAILERKGLAAKAEEALLPLVGSWFRWERDPAKFEEVRQRLAEMIVRGQ
ncbi:MAG: DUF4091 domain-containing protein [Candidatus Nealsonbacteria bacterium]|nr:DUF4091 domain-containing protein [Candidatus Nealsonbacteria bacterium]